MNRRLRVTLWIAGIAIIVTVIVLALMNAPGGPSPSTGGGY